MLIIRSLNLLFSQNQISWRHISLSSSLASHRRITWSPLNRSWRRGPGCPRSRWLDELCIWTIT